MFNPKTTSRPNEIADPKLRSAIQNAAVRIAQTLPHESVPWRITLGEEPYEVCFVHADTETQMPLAVAFLLPYGQLPNTEELCDLFRLTPREAEVALMLANRDSNKEIARRCHFKVATAKRHTERILAKLRITSRREVRNVILGMR